MVLRFTVFLAGRRFTAFLVVLRFTVFFAGARLPKTASLNALSGVMRTLREALIRIASPVAGLRPMRALVCRRINLANPEIITGSPLDTVSVTWSTKEVMTKSMSVLVISASSFRSARVSMSCLRFTFPPSQWLSAFLNSSITPYGPAKRDIGAGDEDRTRVISLEG